MEKIKRAKCRLDSFTEKVQKAADLSFVFFVGYSVECQELGLCVLCLFKGRGICYIVCEIATTCCDEWKRNEQAARETIFFHEQASVVF